MQYSLRYKETAKKQDSHFFASPSRSLHTEEKPASRLDKKRTQQKKPVPKPPLYSVAALIGIILLIIYIVGSQMSKPERVVQQFEEAVHNKDYGYITDVMNDGQDEITATEEDAKAFVSYLTKDKKQFQKTMKKVRDSYMDDPLFADQPIKPFISLKQDGKTWLFFDRYILKVETYKANLSSNYEDVNLYIGSKKVGTTKSADDTVTTQPLFPGIYTFKAQPNKAYGTLETKQKVDVTKSIHNKAQVYLELKGEKIYPSSNYESAHLFVNGKDTGKEIGKIDSFGPVNTDGSVIIYAEKKFKDGVKRSKKVKVEDETDIYLPIGEDETAESAEQAEDKDADVGDFLKTYVSKSMDAVNEHDFSIVEDMLIKGSPYEKQAKEYLKYLKKKGITEDLKEFDIRNIEQVSNDKYVIETSEQFEIHYKDGSTKLKSFNSRYAVQITEDGPKMQDLLESKQVQSEDLD
ncbi:zinc ribbon domain-containing protein [Bacillus songklensis]|uniref:Zinc ribbon domain-containing protein n=1 Tax=Bacillus songklensis TaxID=1069116 RepID=A0ABV8BAX1_9BACI